MPHEVDSLPAAGENLFRYTEYKPICECNYNAQTNNGDCYNNSKPLRLHSGKYNSAGNKTRVTGILVCYNLPRIPDRQLNANFYT